MHYSRRTLGHRWIWTNGRMIFRNLQISIDSSIVPLHQSEIPNFEEETECGKPFNKAKYMYKSIPTFQGANNYLERPIDLLFRPSIYSLFSHILFNSNGYARTCFASQQRGSGTRFLPRMNPAIFHIVTGAPGIGKSVIRMPLIALIMSLGVNQVGTARKHEPSFLFVNRNPITNGTDPIPCDYDERSFQKRPSPQIGKASITINRKHRPAVRMERDTFCYTYNVFMCLPTSENEEYDPAHAFSSQTPIGQLTMPSIHHFPHFFKLFVNQDNQVENRLRGTTWHVVDDLILQRSKIPHCDHVVQLASPNKKRWKDTTEHDPSKNPCMVYNVPTLLFPEIVHMFNAIPCPYEYDTDEDSLMMESQNTVRLQGMIPRDVFTPCLRNDMYRNIHPSSPQFDPLNGFTQHATLDASQIVEGRTTVTITKFKGLNLISRGNIHLRAAGYYKGQNEVFLSAVENGLILTQLRPIGSPTFNSPTVSFPKTKSSLVEMMNDSLHIQKITIPDAASFIGHETEAYNPQWDFLFQRCLHKEALTCFSPPNDADNTMDTDEDFVTGEHRAHWARLQVVTRHLVPNRKPDAAFDSILVMFRFLKESDVLHSLGVFFLKNSIESKCDISDEGVRLMKKYCYLLARLYRLKRVQLFPSFIVVADSNKCPNINTKRIQKLESFIAMQNMWVAQFEAKREIDVEDVEIPAMAASTAPVLARFTDLEVNRNPHAVRCSFCGSLVAENFPNHCCEAMWFNIPRIRENLKLIDLVYSDERKLLSAAEHFRIERRNERRHSIFSTTVVFEETQLSARKPSKTTQKNDEKPEPNTVEISVDFVKNTSVIQHKKANSGLWPPIPSPSHQTDFVRVTCTSEIPGTPDFYRQPFPSLESKMGGTTTTPNDAVHHRASPQQSSQSPNDPSNIVEAHCLWSDGFKLSFEKRSKCQYNIVQLAEQPYQSLEYDVPSVDIRNHNHNAQFMLPAGTNANLGSVDVHCENRTDPLQDKRIQYESFWQSLNRQNPSAGMDGTLQKDENELMKKIHKCEDKTMKSQLTCVLAKGLLLRSRLSLQSGDLTTAMSFLVRSKQHMVLNDTTEVECELIKSIQDCENEIMKTHPTCLEAKELLLRSRLSLQSGDTETAIFLFKQTKQHMEMNDTGVLESERRHACSSGPETSSHRFDELERVAANARDCFGINWERWIREGQNLPIILNPSFHILQHHLRQVQDHVTALGSCLETLVVEIPAKEPSRDTPGSASTDEQHTNEAERSMVNTILQALKEGLSLQLRIAWETGSQNQVTYFQNELKSIHRIYGDTSVPPLPATFKSQTEQIEELDIDVVTTAIRNILDTIRNHCSTWRALVREHQHTLSSTPRPPGNLEGTRRTNEVRMVIGGNPAASDPLPQHANVPHEIRVNAQLLFDRISGIIAACHWKLEKTGNNEMMNDLYEMITELNHFVTTTSDCDGNVETVASRSSDFMLIDEREEETPLLGGLENQSSTSTRNPSGQRRQKAKETNLNCGQTPSATEIGGKPFGKQKRGDQTGMGLNDAPFKADKRMQISNTPSRGGTSTPHRNHRSPKRANHSEQTWSKK
ncbi:hypothetical protein BLNAU_20092 [Blattamonas nauphoetae]|uniref:Uncharacterized protein n=1 Tax=Blattamonas nauphoetae TaxID=2049346 RepID=A0ABQ9WZM8_9EUKA|nr:hypothetical protein BLNAU_20092 [Blattamonas nauphoetae]